MEFLTNRRNRDVEAHVFPTELAAQANIAGQPNWYVYETEPVANGFIVRAILEKSRRDAGWIADPDAFFTVPAA